MSETKRPHGSRFRDALVIINPGACNPSGVALSIADACREMREHENVDTKHICQDPAVRLMVYQLAHLFGVAGSQYDVVYYMTDEAACKERLAELGLKPLRSQLTNLTPADRSWRGLGRWKHPTGEIPMPKFVIERQYLVPLYQHIVVEAENLEEACKKGISDDIDWDSQEMDCDSARATTITEAKMVPEGYEADQTHSLIIASRDPKGLPLDMLSFATFLYEDEAKTGPLLEIPAKFTDDE